MGIIKIGFIKGAQYKFWISDTARIYLCAGSLIMDEGGIQTLQKLDANDAIKLGNYIHVDPSSWNKKEDWYVLAEKKI